MIHLLFCLKINRQDGRISIIEPTDDHERLIAHAVDEKLLEDPGSPYACIVPEIATSLGFLMSPPDTQFLVRYVQWRIKIIRGRGSDILPNPDDKQTPWAKARIQNGLSLRAIADETMIGVPFLEAIEAGDFRQLPGGVYAESFIQQLAAAVGYDATEILAAYYRATGSERSAS